MTCHRDELSNAVHARSQSPAACRSPSGPQCAVSRCRQAGTVVFPHLKPAQTDHGTLRPILWVIPMRFLPSMLALCLSAPLFAGGVSTPQQGHAEILGTLLYTDISVDWQEVSAREAMADIEALLGTAPQVYWERDNRPGMERELPITLRMENQPMLRVLDRLLDECSDSEECGWQLRDGLLEIGLKSHLGRRAAQELEVYPILDLLFVVRSFDNAPEMGTQSGGGGSGGGGGGGAGLSTPPGPCSFSIIRYADSTKFLKFLGFIMGVPVY